MIKEYIKKRLHLILLVVFTSALISGVVYAANTLDKTITGGIEIVTTSGGGSGNTTPPDPDNLTILNLLNFIDVPTTTTAPLSGNVTIQNDTGVDLYYISCSIDVDASLGSMSISTSDNLTIMAGATQTLDIVYTPVGGGMPLGNYDYTISINYSY